MTADIDYTALYTAKFIQLLGIPSVDYSSRVISVLSGYPWKSS